MSVGSPMSKIWQRQLAQSNHEIPPSVDHTHRQWPFCRGIWEVPLTELAIKTARYDLCSRENGLNIALNMRGIVSSFCVPYMKYDSPLMCTRRGLGGSHPVGLRSLFAFQKNRLLPYYNTRTVLSVVLLGFTTIGMYIHKYNNRRWQTLKLYCFKDMLQNMIHHFVEFEQTPSSRGWLVGMCYGVSWVCLHWFHHNSCSTSNKSDFSFCWWTHFSFKRRESAFRVNYKALSVVDDWSIFIQSTFFYLVQKGQKVKEKCDKLQIC